MFMGHLALGCNVDLLPVYIGGTHAAMPKGAAFPRSRRIQARIGMPLCISDLRRLTAGMTQADSVREVSRLARQAVLALKDGGVLDLSKIKRLEETKKETTHPLVSLFGELEHKFKPQAVAKPVSFYFTLGNDSHAKWTVKIDAAYVDARSELTRLPSRLRRR